MENIHTISASWYSLNTSRVDLSVPLNIVGSSGIAISKLDVSNSNSTVTHTRDDCQTASQICQSYLGDVNTVHHNPALSCFDEAEE